jgi:hypothetical protein
MRSDPSDNGGLFVGRRPGTAPVRFRSLPQRGSKSRRRVDASLANLLFAMMTFLSLMCWGPIPILCLWVGSQIDYHSGSVSLGIFLAFLTLLITLLGTLMILRRLDQAWILIRRAAGYDQRLGALGRIFAATAAVCAVSFVLWFVLIHGPGQTLSSGNAGQ